MCLVRLHLGNNSQSWVANCSALCVIDPLQQSHFAGSCVLFVKGIFAWIIVHTFCDMISSSRTLAYNLLQIWERTALEKCAWYPWVDSWKKKKKWMYLPDFWILDVINFCIPVLIPINHPSVYQFCKKKEKTKQNKTKTPNFTKIGCF